MCRSNARYGNRLNRVPCPQCPWGSPHCPEELGGADIPATPQICNILRDPIQAHTRSYPQAIQESIRAEAAVGRGEQPREGGILSVDCLDPNKQEQSMTVFGLIRGQISQVTPPQLNPPPV